MVLIWLTQKDSHQIQTQWLSSYVVIFLFIFSIIIHSLLRKNRATFRPTLLSYFFSILIHMFHLHLHSFSACPDFQYLPLFTYFFPSFKTLWKGFVWKKITRCKIQFLEDSDNCIRAMHFQLVRDPLGFESLCTIYVA